MNLSVLVLESGKYFIGESFGKEAPTVTQFLSICSSDIERAKYFSGELVFNTAMSGYVEVLSDPSFSGQMICMTYPHIGNYGVDRNWIESGVNMLSSEKKEVHISHTRKEIMASGLIIKNLYEGPVPKGRMTLDEWMQKEGICGISKIDTRALTLYLRDKGNENAVILQIDKNIFQKEIENTVELMKKFPTMKGRDLVSAVGLTDTLYKSSFKHNDSASQKFSDSLRIGILDLGCKHNIIRLFERRNCNVVLFKKDVNVEEVLKQNLDMVLVSNGPGDPSVLGVQKDIVRAMIGKVTLCGICLGTQLLALSIGAKTYKMPFGHHGINHPVRDELQKKLYITSQNHGFAVDEKTLPEGALPWFRNTNDNTLEGFIYPSKRMYSVQFHPEAAPGPTDTTWIIDYFIENAQKFIEGKE